MIYTIGHSTLAPDKFIELISGLDVILDIRSHPGSVHSHFNKEYLEKWLPGNNIEYQWEPRLGGWSNSFSKYSADFRKYGVDVDCYCKTKFPKQRIAKSTTKSTRGKGPFWTNMGLYDYQFFMTINEFYAGMNDLLVLGREKNVGIMCCEILPWKCHRSMVADFICWLGDIDPIHLQPKEKPHSEMISNRLARYHEDVINSWSIAVENTNEFPMLLR